VADEINRTVLRGGAMKYIGALTIEAAKELTVTLERNTGTVTAIYYNPTNPSGWPYEVEYDD